MRAGLLLLLFDFIRKSDLSTVRSCSPPLPLGLSVRSQCSLCISVLSPAVPEYEQPAQEENLLARGHARAAALAKLSQYQASVPWAISGRDLAEGPGAAAPDRGGVLAVLARARGVRVLPRKLEAHVPHLERRGDVPTVVKTSATRNDAQLQYKAALLEWWRMDSLHLLNSSKTMFRASAEVVCDSEGGAPP